MSQIAQILEYNKKFVADKEYEKYSATKFPDKKIAIVSCMDARLTELLPAALGLRNGDAKIIKNAGAMITHPYGSGMRSLLVAVWALGVEEILVIGHKDCGMQDFDARKIIPAAALDAVEKSGIDVDRWLKGFASVEDSVRDTTGIIRNHPLMPKDITVYGFVIDPATGALDQIV
ncbi:MAG: carbonic anhydrase [Rickettsiales bacterium]|jgi:carbonic anhydrase|nr:carbonic anhydrase [Rickettsiales bacterium]